MNSETTIYNIVNEIKFKKIKPLKLGHINQEISRNQWSLQQNQQFYQLILEYGTDYSIINSFFPHRSRGQIKKKYMKIMRNIAKLEEKSQQRKSKEKKKIFFDQELLSRHGLEEENSQNEQCSSSDEN